MHNFDAFKKEKERLRLKIIERLLKEGSSAEEPLNIPLSDYSSDEGDTSSSDNEGKSIRHSDLEGPCCAPTRAPPCSPEAQAEIRKFLQRRTRKIMQELDRIYFQPLFKKKFRALIRAKRLKLKPSKSDHRTKNTKIPAVGPKHNSKDTESETPAETAIDGSEGDIIIRSPSERRSEFEKSILNTFEGSRLVSGLSRNIKVKSCKKQKASEDDESGIYAPEKPLPRKLRVSRKLRLWLEKRKILIIRKLKKSRSKLRCRAWHAKSKACRLTYDMPTTDPGSDLIFSTDDEYNIESSDFTTKNEMRITPSQTRRLLQSDLQRKYIEEFGDNFTVVKRQMQRELMLSSSAKPDTKPKLLNYPFPVQSLRSPMPRTAPQQQPQPVQPPTEFPMIAIPSTQRTGSWHSLQTNKATSTKPKNANPYLPMSDNLTSDDLQFRLSLKKKIWSGVQLEGASSNNKEPMRSRPLSWGMPPVVLQTKMEKYSNINTDSKKYDKEAALLNACSQKLIAWQQQNKMNSVSKIDSENSNIKEDKGKFVPNLSTADSLDKDISYSAYQKTTYKCLPTTTDSKSKKRKNPISKINETAQLLTRYNKSKINASQNSRLQGGNHKSRLKSAEPSSSDANLNGKISSQMNKFKTGGLVATATAQPKKNLKSRISSNIVNKTSEASADVRRTSAFDGKERSVEIITIDMQAPPSIQDQEPRKITTKLRRKIKSKTNLAISR